MMRPLVRLLVVAVLSAPGSTAAQEAAVVTQANWRLAARFAPYRIRNLVHSTSVQPRWIQGTERFWYEWETGEGKFFYVVDPVAGTRRELFDRDRIAAELTRITHDPWDAQHLPIRAIRFIDGNTLEFEVESSQDEEVRRDTTEAERGEGQRGTQGARAGRPRPRKQVFHFRYTISTRTLVQIPEYQHPDNHPTWASVAPDGQAVIFARRDNLFMMNAEAYRQVLDARRGKTGAAADSADWRVEVEEVQLTTDGEEHYSYASGFGGQGDTDDEERRAVDRRKAANISWSPDSRRFAMVRQDQRLSGDLWVIHNTGSRRPRLETYRYDMAGDTNVAQAHLLVYDVPSRAMIEVQAGDWKDQRIGLFPARRFTYPDANEPRRALWLAPNSDQVYFWRRSRDQHRVDVMVANAATGEARVLIEERLNTYVEHENLELLPSGDMLWWSERDGWAHLYRFSADGALRNRLTEGPWHVGGIEGVDPTRGLVYLTGNGHEAGEDPYYEHLYRVALDGSGLTLLNPGDFHHGTNQGESNRYFVDNYSRVNTVPASALIDATTGRRILELGAADFAALTAAGYQFPEPFTVKAADGITDLYGVIYRPFDFDSTRQYPIIEYVYPGPQTEAVSKGWSSAPNEVGLAQLGFVVVTIGNRGGHPNRSKWYHNYGYGNLRDYGLADKKTTVEQLAQRYSWIDIERVGIYGHSGGGFMSTAAMLIYPDFFDVAVSSSGNHENDIYNANWSEKHHGIREQIRNDSTVFEYSIARNSQLAGNLQGHLLLTTGDIDNNVHPANTIRMAEALIRANKRFDFFLFPSQRHGYVTMADYWFWLRAEYFARWLLGDERTGADIVELRLEREQTR